MNTTEYALCRGGAVVDVVMTRQTLEQARACYPEFDVQPLDDLPAWMKSRYQFWGERP